jgi:hypothetical protein
VASPAASGRAPARTTTPPKPQPVVTERMLLTIQGKNYGDPSQIDRLIEEITRHPFFKERLRADQPVLLKELLPRQLDPGSTDRSFALFLIECYGAERLLQNE